MNKLVSISLVAGLTGCGGIFEPSTTQEDVAVLRYYGDTTVISAPDTVDRGASFTVRITTFAGGCTRKTARADVTITGSVAEIRPYNLNVRPHGGICSLDLLFLEHKVEMRLETAGVAVIRVIGSQYEVNAGNPAPLVTFERRVVVR